MLDILPSTLVLLEFNLFYNKTTRSSMFLYALSIFFSTPNFSVLVSILLTLETNVSVFLGASLSTTLLSLLKSVKAVLNSSTSILSGSTF